MKLTYSLSAAKQLSHLPSEVQRRIAQKMRFYLAQPDPIQFAKSLTNSRFGLHRYRVGEYRVIVEFQRDIVFVTKIAKRDPVYL